MFNAFSVLIVVNLKILIMNFIVSLQTRNGFNIENFSLSDLDPLSN